MMTATRPMRSHVGQSIIVLLQSPMDATDDDLAVELVAITVKETHVSSHVPIQSVKVDDYSFGAGKRERGLSI